MGTDDRTPSGGLGTNPALAVSDAEYDRLHERARVRSLCVDPVPDLEASSLHLHPDLYAMAELKSLRRLPYADYLQSNHWQRMRALALEHHRDRCVVCGGTRRLQVHHRSYDRLGEETLADLTVLCRRCHATHHGKAAAA